MTEKIIAVLRHCVTTAETPEAAANEENWTCVDINLQQKNGKFSFLPTENVGYGDEPSSFDEMSSWKTMKANLDAGIPNTNVNTLTQMFYRGGNEDVKILSNISELSFAEFSDLN